MDSHSLRSLPLNQRREKAAPEAPAPAPDPAQSARWLRLRVALLGGGLASLLLLALSRAYSLQTDDYERLSSLSQQMYDREYTLRGARGAIYDRDQRELAVTLSVESIYADPKLLSEDPALRREQIVALAKALQLSPKELAGKLSPEKHFVWLKRFASPEEVAAVSALEIPGVDTRPEYRRFYPARELGAHLLGFVTRDGEAEGLERKLQQTLEGSTGSVPMLIDATGKRGMLDGGIPAASLEGNSVVLSLSSQLQYLAERELQKAIAATKAKGGTVIATDPYTGEILALANWPTFNPNEPGASSADNRRNRAITDPFEPGSTLKSFVYSAAIEENLISPEGWTFCDDALKIGTRTIHDSHNIGNTTWAGALAESSNTCAYAVGQKLGPERLYQYLRAFGFGESTQVGLPGESSGVLRKWQQWREINLATISFGHGITVTAVQEAMAMGAIANGGLLMAPRLIKRVLGPDGSVKKEFHPEALRRAVSEKTTRTVTDMLLGVTREGGSAPKAALRDYAVAGKTGTAQKVINGGYLPGHYISSFVGFAPASAPRLVVVVVLDDPQGQHYGGQVAAPVFRAVAEEALWSMGVAPAPDTWVNPKKKNLSGEKSASVSEEAPSSAPASAPSAPAAWTARQQAGLPDFAGLTLGDALRLARSQGLELSVSGTGIAVAQDPAPGTEARAVSVTFREGPDETVSVAPQP